MLEHLLLRHASPTLAGIKTANLFSCSADCEQEISSCIRNWNQVLNPKGVYLKMLRYDGKSALLYCYRQRRLQAELLDAARSEFLCRFGYDCHCIDSCLAHLKTRIEAEPFPHEIGVFLGYPLHDIQAFIANKGQNYKVCGHWKAYENVPQAQKTFALYKKCTKAYCDQFAKGKAITQLAVAGK